MHLNAFLKSLRAPDDSPEIHEIGEREPQTRKAESSSDCIVTIDDQNEILDFNRAAEMTFGCSRRDAIGRDFCATLLPASNRETYRAGIVPCLQAAKGELLDHHIELVGMRADKSEFPLALTVRRIRDHEPPRFAAFMRDITNEGATREQLHNQEEQYRQLFERIPIPTFVYDPGTLAYLAVNEAAIQHYGYSRNEFLAMTLKDIRPEEDGPAFLASLASGGSIGYGVWRNRKKTGQLIEVQLTIQPIRFEGIDAGLIMAEDVTERRRTESERRLSESRLRAIVESEPECVTTVSADGCLLDMNRAGLAMIEAGSLDAVRNMLVRNLVHPDDRAAFDALHQRAFNGEKGELQFRLTGLKGKERWMETHSVALPDAAGDASSVLSITRDITERLRADEALRIQAAILDNIGQAVIATDLTGKIIYANRSAGELYGWWSLAEMRGVNVMDVLVPQTSLTQAEDIMSRLTKGENWSGEFLCRRRDGTEFEAFVTNSPLLDPAGRLIGVIGISGDISERKQAESSLRQSEAELENAQRIAHLGSWKWNLSTGDMDCTAEVYRIFGTTPGNSGTNYEMFQQAIHPEDFGRVKAAVADARAGFGAYSVDYRAIRPDGSERLIHEEAEVEFNNAEQPVCVTGTVQDITTRKAIEAKLRESNQRNREQAALLDLAHDAIIVRSMDDRILFYNHGAETLYGWTAAEVIGKPVSSFLLPSEAALFVSAHTAVVESGHWSGECKHPCKDGGVVIVRSRWTLVKNEQGEAKSVLIINTDVTEQKKIEEQFLRAQRLESIGTLASGVAHDLNNILAPILMSIPLLRSELPPEVKEKIISTIEQSADRGTHVVKQVLTFAQGLDRERILIDPRYLIKEMADIAEQTFPRSISVKTKYPEDLWLVEGDPTQIHQVLLNLSVNARDAMPGGGTLLISAENFQVDEHYASMEPGASAGPHVLLAVTDSGEGMARELLDKIFDPFFTTKEVGKGTGLGLSTVLGIVKSHGGFTSVSSDLGNGTTFQIFLPAIPGMRMETPPRGEPGVGCGETILIVDDEPTIVAITKLILETHNYRVFTAEDGPQALAVFAQQMDSIDLVMTDLMMPFMDGIALIRSIKQMKPEVSIVASTGQGEQARFAELKSLGVHAALPKPYHREKLLETLREVLDQRKTHECPANE